MADRGEGAADFAGDCLDNNCWNNYRRGMEERSAPLARPAKPRFASLEQEVFLGLWRTWDRLKAIEEEFFAGYGLTGQQYNVLRLLVHVPEPGIPTLELANRLVSRAPDITRMLDKLELREFIQRVRPSQDRRVVYVTLSDKGRELVKNITEPLRECHQRQLGHLTKTELKALSALLRSARRPHEADESVWH